MHTKRTKIYQPITTNTERAISNAPALRSDSAVAAKHADLEGLKERLLAQNKDYFEAEIEREFQVIGEALDAEDAIHLRGRDWKWYQVVIRNRNLNHLEINDVLLTIDRHCTMKYGGVNKVFKIDLRDNDIKGEIDWELVAAFKNIRYLYLDGNPITLSPEPWDILPRSLEKVDSTKNPKFERWAFQP